MISFSCKCGKGYEVTDKYAGKKVRCKKCDNVMQIPGGKEDSAVMMTEIIEPDHEQANFTRKYNPKKSAAASISENSGLPKPMIFTFIGVGVFITGLLLYFFVIRDTWERDNLVKISQMISEAERLCSPENYEEGSRIVRDLLLLIDHRELKNESLRREYRDLHANYDSMRREINLERKRIAEAERKRKQAEIAIQKRIEEEKMAEAARKEEEKKAEIARKLEVQKKLEQEMSVKNAQQELAIRSRINAAKINGQYYDADKIIPLLQASELTEELVVCFSIDRVNLLISKYISQTSAKDFSSAVDNLNNYGSASGASTRAYYEQKALRDLANFKTTYKNFQGGSNAIKSKLSTDPEFKRRWDIYVKKYKNSRCLPDDLKKNLRYSFENFE